ncbi:hypothetical protein IQ13_3741 [Lacibacter cauensis]|uniref:Uncharacterized protein n=1 Tax=Lacibacter cauensis TaxID=510947 RepID=A0A562SDH3_9BACT|nr:hypothetical protein [Lacibacter cauensis]TWI79337.1 hypothetical protein IQ13_3741 [Lacibacter cauensis]
MTFNYFKRFWDESTGDPLTDSWGTSTYYFETDSNGEVLRQIEVYENGKVLKYDQNNVEDEYGALSNNTLDVDEFKDFKIEKTEFEEVWAHQE